MSSKLKEVYISLYRALNPGFLDLDQLDKTNEDLFQRLNLLIQASREIPEVNVPSQVLIGTLPLQTFNAQAVKHEAGFLILINHSLMIFSLQIASLVAGLMEATSNGKTVGKLSPN
ncbi:MAG: hypothetical protein CL607_17785 [Anaerolineaceae bacterium]|nr:hypothetical protein [Anaerolineaceae bacterium]